MEPEIIEMNKKIFEFVGNNLKPNSDKEFYELLSDYKTLLENRWKNDKGIN